MPEKKSISAFYRPQEFDDAAIMKFMNQEVPDLYDMLDKRAKEDNTRAEADIRQVAAKKAKQTFDDDNRISEQFTSWRAENPDATPEEVDNFILNAVAGTGNINQYSKLQSDRSLTDARRAAANRSKYSTAATVAKYDPDGANAMLQELGLPPVDLSAAREVNVPTIGRVRPRRGGGYDTIVPAREPKEPQFREPVVLENPATGQAVTVDSEEEYSDLLAKGFRKPRAGGGSPEEMIKGLLGDAPEAPSAPIPTPKPDFIMKRRQQK